MTNSNLQILNNNFTNLSTLAHHYDTDYGLIVTNLSLCPTNALAATAFAKVTALGLALGRSMATFH